MKRTSKREFQRREIPSTWRDSTATPSSARCMETHTTEPNVPSSTLSIDQKQIDRGPSSTKEAILGYSIIHTESTTAAPDNMSLTETKRNLALRAELDARRLNEAALREIIMDLSKQLAFAQDENAQLTEKLNTTALLLKARDQEASDLKEQLDTVQGELEDLCASLFSAANEMVSTERKSVAELRDANSALRQQLRTLKHTLTSEQTTVATLLRKMDQISTWMHEINEVGVDRVKNAPESRFRTLRVKKSTWYDTMRRVRAFETAETPEQDKEATFPLTMLSPFQQLHWISSPELAASLESWKTSCLSSERAELEIWAPEISQLLKRVSPDISDHIERAVSENMLELCVSGGQVNQGHCNTCKRPAALPYAMSITGNRKEICSWCRLRIVSAVELAKALRNKSSQQMHKIILLKLLCALLNMLP